MADTDNLASTLTDDSEGSSPTPAGSALAGAGNAPDVGLASPPSTPEEAPDIGAGTPGTGPSNLASAAITAAQPDLPRFRRTFGNTLKGMLVGFGLGGVPGMVAGGISPQGIDREAQSRAAVAAANQHFASARAAHETAQAALLEKQVNAFDEDHQQQMEKIGLDNLKAAQEAGFKIVGVTPLDGEPADNAKAAMNNLQQIQKNNGGQVPEGLLHIHGGNGNGIFTLQLQDPAAALGVVNQTRRAQGLPELDSNTFMGLSPQERQSQAKDAINFTNPTDPQSGQISQNSVTTLENRLALVKAQPAFNGKDALVTNLQQNLDFQKSALEHEATRKGQAAGSEAMAAQPGQTEAKRAELGVMAGPEAQAAAQKAGAVAAAELPAKLALAKEEHAEDQGFAFNQKTGQRELISRGDAKDKGFTNWTKVSQGDEEKETNLNSQMNDMQLNTSRYRASLNAMGDLTSNDRQAMLNILNVPDVKNILAGAVDVGSIATGGGSLEQLLAGRAAGSWNSLSPDKQEALIGFLRMKNTALLAQKVLTGMGRASKEALDIELANMPSPLEGATVGNKKLDAWQENLDQINSRSVKLPWMESPLDVRKRVEEQATKTYNAKQAASSQPKPAETETRRRHHGLPE